MGGLMLCQAQTGSSTNARQTNLVISWSSVGFYLGEIDWMCHWLRTVCLKVHRIVFAEIHPSIIKDRHSDYFHSTLRLQILNILKKGLNFSISKSSLFDSMPYQSSVKSLSSPLFESLHVPAN